MILNSMYEIAKPYIEGKFILRHFEIYHEFDFVLAETIITIIEMDTRKEYTVTLPYIQRDTNIIFNVARNVIESEGVQ